MMNGKRFLLVLLVGISFFNSIFIAFQVTQEVSDPLWIFPDLGPAVIQDSPFGRSPVLESPIGIIGDQPGGYPLYSGNPLQSRNFTLTLQDMDEPVFLVILMLGVIPSLVVLIIGRRSYGSSKTQ